MKALPGAAGMICGWAFPGLVMAAEVVTPDTVLRLIVAVFLLLLMIAAFGMIFILQRRFLNECRQGSNLELYARLPFGVPEGTIRSMLALIIIFASVGYVALSMIPGKDIKFPEVMVGILGTVLGFYFGSRTEAGRVGAEALAPVGAAKRARDEAFKARDQSQLRQVLDKAHSAINAARVLVKVLPPEIADKVGGMIETADKGLQTADRLAQAGRVQEALEAAD